MTFHQRCGRVLVEAAFVLLSGLLIALACNGLSPRGLTLTRDYFPTSSSQAPSNGLPQAASRESDPAVVAGTPDFPSTQIDQEGFAIVEHDMAVSKFEDPRYQQGLIVFIDARNRQDYEQGHIPGAFQFDHYYPQNHLEEVLPACMNAETVVVYCSGGRCEDSLFAAIMLRDAGVPGQNILVYAGGIAEWMEQGQPLELGPRLSGQVSTGTNEP